MCVHICVCGWVGGCVCVCVCIYIHNWHIYTHPQFQEILWMCVHIWVGGWLCMCVYIYIHNWHIYTHPQFQEILTYKKRDMHNEGWHSQGGWQRCSGRVAKLQDKRHQAFLCLGPNPASHLFSNAIIFLFLKNNLLENS